MGATDHAFKVIGLDSEGDINRVTEDRAIT